MGDQAVGQHRHGQGFHIVGDYIVPALDGGQCLAAAHQSQHRPGRGSQPDLHRVSRRLTNGSDVGQDVVADGAPLAQLHGLQDFLPGGNAGDGLQGGGHHKPLQQGHCLLALGVAQGKAHEETVQLGLRQGEGSLALHRVFRGDDQKGCLQGIGHATFGDLPLLHALQQRGLGPGSGAVDLIGQENVGKSGAGEEGKFPVFLVVDPHTDDVRGQQVRGELDPGEFAVQAGSQSLGKGGLAGAGHILQQHMTAGQKGAEDQPDLLLLADDHLVDVFLDFLCQGRDLSVLHSGTLPLYVFVVYYNGLPRQWQEKHCRRNHSQL